MLAAKLLKACPVSSTLSSPITNLKFPVKQLYWSYDFQSADVVLGGRNVVLKLLSGVLSEVEKGERESPRQFLAKSRTISNVIPLVVVAFTFWTNKIMI